MGVAMFTLGGTIGMYERDGTVTRLTGAHLTEAVPGLAEVDLAVRDIEAVPSADLTIDRMLDVIEAAELAIAEGATGIVVTQGTDTIEETAFLVDLLWPHPEPFVFTGAMRNPRLAGPDGPANVLAAARVAASAQARDRGALLVFADEVHAARWVRKTHSTSIATFQSPNVGPIGHVVEGEVRLLAEPPRRPVVVEPSARPSLRAALATTRVGLYTVALDDEGSLLDAAAEIYQGLVVAAFGVGHVPGHLAPRLGAIAERMPVVLASRTGAGSVLSGTYHAPGSETDLQRRGLLSARFLTPYQARLLLRLLLATDRSAPEDLRAAFGIYG